MKLDEGRWERNFIGKTVRDADADILPSTLLTGSIESHHKIMNGNKMKVVKWWTVCCIDGRKILYDEGDTNR